MNDSTRQLLQLLDQFGARLHVLLTRITLCPEAADDLLQELFLRLQSSEAFPRAKSPRHYLFRSAINLAYDWRRISSRSQLVCPLPSPEPSQYADPTMELIRTEDYDLLLLALQQLPVWDRELLTLRYFDGATPEELGLLLGRTAHQVRALCSKAITRLRRQMDSTGACKPSQETRDVQH